MASRRAQAVGALDDDAALLADGADALRSLAHLVAAIDRRNLWVEIAWEPETAAAGARRDVARVRRALEVGRTAVGERRTGV